MCGSEESRKEARRLTALVYWDRGTVWIIGGASGWVSAAWTWGWLSCQRLFRYSLRFRVGEVVDERA